MEAVGIAARLSSLSAHVFIDAIDDYVVAPLLGAQHPITLLRRFLITWTFLYLSALVVYFFFASLDYLVYFVLLAPRLHAPGYVASLNVRREISMSVRSLILMTLLSTPMEVLFQIGYGKVYSDPAQHGYAYLALSPLFFIAFSDCLIYFIHRGLHHRLVYRHIHKPHHSFINTSPFAAFAFHPLDGFSQGVPYQLFVLLFPLHEGVHLVSLLAVLMWTINIHDRVDFGIPGVNGAAHHTIHHTTFKSNYGQYFTVWDRLCGTFRDPRQWAKDGQPVLDEKHVYGKYA